MTMSRTEKILIALILAGTLALPARAATYDVYSSDYATVTVTVDTKTETYTYTDADGETHTCEYTTVTSAPTVTVNVTELSDLSLSYDSPNGGTNEKYYAWVEDTDDSTGLGTGSYTFKEVEDSSAAQVTVKYVQNESTGIYNDGTDETINGKDISADFVSDTKHGESSGNHGGAIDNVASSSDASLGTIAGNFIGNYEDDTSGADYGGAIANYGSSSHTAEIKAIKGNFIGNHVTTTESGNYAQGGAIFNGTNGTIGDITASFIGNFVNSSSVYSYGGAIYNHGTIGDIKGDFIGNYVKLTETESTATTTTHAWGGAIVNNGGTIKDITGNFICNYVEASGISSAMGGAIYNYSSGTIGDIVGDFIGNYVKVTYNGSSDNRTNRNARGGAINNDSSSSTINSIMGDFISNSATSTGDNAFGGAIYNSGKIGTENNDAGIDGNFIDNHAYGNSDDSSNTAYAYGGAIYNSGTIYGIKGDFIGNSAESTSRQVYGGAIYNTGTITLIEGDFIDNAAITSSSRAYGGAIYNQSGTINAIKGNFIGNYAETTATSEGNSYAAYGGAIDNTGGTIGTISGDFISNHANSNASYAYGGAIYNVVDDSSGSGGTIESIAGNFIGNYAISSSETSAGAVAWGGAIYNTGTISGSTSSTGTTTAAISANFIDNYSKSSANDSYGGAIFNRGTIGTLDDKNAVSIAGISNSTFQENTATRGGAIYNGTQKTETDDEEVTGSGYETYTSVIASIENTSFVNNTATKYGGAIYNYDDGAIYNIEDCYFEGNVAEDGNGGAIENAEANSYIGTITGNYFYKNDVSQSEHGGGAIYSEGIIDSITKNDFVENTSGNFGGAIYNNGGSIAGSGGAIEENYFYKNGSNRGGAIYNTVTRSVLSESDANYSYTGTNHETFDLALITSAEGSGTIFSITGNTFMNNKANNFGGAIYNYHGGDIGAISDNLFYGNEANGGNGGAVENAEFDTSIGTMDNNVFVDNTSTGNGGAIYNQGTIGIIETTDETTGEVTRSVGNAITNSTFTGNTAKNGGAIYNNYGTSTVYFYDEDSSSIEGAEEVEGASKDGDGHTLYSVEEAGAGAIGNISNSYFEGNKATAGSGGAIYNASGTVTDEETGETVTYTTTIGTITNTSFVENSATDKGGAIYSATDLSIAADGSQDVNGDSTVVFQGNTDGTDDNAIYMAQHYDDEGASVASNISFSLANGGSIYLYDNIKGEGNYSVDISGDGLDTTFYLLNDVNAVSEESESSEVQPLAASVATTNNADLSVGGVTLVTMNDDSHAYNVGSFTVTDNFDMHTDVDLANETMDRFVTYGEDYVYTKDDTANYGTAGGTLNLAGLNLISDTEKDSVAVYFAEPGLMDDVTLSVHTAYTPIFQYNVDYIIYDDGKLYDENGNQTVDYDTALFSKDQGGYLAFDNTGFNPAVMATPVAVMGAYNAFGLMFDYNFEHSDYFMKLPAEDRLALSEEQKKAKRAPKENDATKPAYYNQNELTERGAWMRAFAANESVDYGGGWESRDKYYGAMVGFDSNMRVSDNGWASVLTGYAGMLGIRQTYSGGNIRQKGGFVGLTESFYKKNFYTAWTIAAGTTKAHDYTMYGHDNSRLDEYGIAGRFGWNIPLGDGKFSLLPTFTASFTYINPEDYTNAGGVHISGDGFYAVQLNPNLKFIMNMENGWQPYLTVGEVWTVGETSKIYANEYKLDELDLDPYTEYGIGVQKRWANERDAYVQVLGHSHGRDGILVNAGIRWNF